MPSIIALDDTLGAVLVGVIASAVIYGITMLQMYTYFSDLGRKDGLYLRLFVFALAFFDTVHLSLISHSIYWYVITNFGDFFSILKIDWSMILQVPLGGILAVSVQGFFARRIYILSQGRALPICLIIGLLAAAEMSMMIAVAYMAFQIKIIAETWRQTPYLMAAVSLELACNSTITCSMVYYLWQGRSGIKKTDGIVKKLMFYSVESGLLIAIAAAALAGVFIHDPNHMVYTPFFFVIIRLYPCTFVTTLNTRKFVRAELNSGGATTISLGGMGMNSSRSSDKRYGSGRPDPHAISTLHFAAPTSSEGTTTIDIIDAAGKCEVGKSTIE